MKTPNSPEGNFIEARLSKIETWIVVYARIALGTAFLSAVAGRFGLWHGSINMKYFSNFLEYTAEVNSFMSPTSIQYIAWAATVAEIMIGILLLLGLWLRWVSLAAAALLALFGTAMAISLGLKSPMDYSVYSASSAALLLALHSFNREPSRKNPSKEL
jgi:uncharacterized membrane protein YphA (DoxX/SURF4 family)